jgi:site-specific DNA-methyltransferase (adenine-specific)
MKKSDLWRTPLEIYKLLDKEFHFDFDPCPFSSVDWDVFDGLKIEWGSCNFVNPPYSETEKWVKRL